MKCKTLDEMRPLLKNRWGTEYAEKILQEAACILQQLRDENSAAPRAVRKHTDDDIFPCISLYRALQKNGTESDSALAFLDESWSARAAKNAAAMKKLLRFAGLYQLYPAMFRQVAKSQFGTAAGFSAVFYDEGKGHCRFDMTKCLFLDTCTRYGCPELTICFCHTDDINNADLHPHLCWNRTRCMGCGGDLCDFDIFVK